MSDTPKTDAVAYAIGLNPDKTYKTTFGHTDFWTMVEQSREIERAIHRWTPTSDLAALPPFDTYVIVHSRSGVTSLMHRSRHGTHHGGWAWRAYGKTWSQSEITHWMPKPEAPEKEVTK